MSWRKSSIVWFLIDFFVGAVSVMFAYRGVSLPIDLETLEPLPWHPGAIPASLLFGGILGVSFYAFGGEAREWRRYSWQRNVIVSITCVVVATAVVVLIFYLFLLQIGRVVIGLVAIQAFVGTYLVRLICFARGNDEKRALLLITDEEHRPSPQMSKLIEGYYEVIELDRSVLSRSDSNHWIEEWQGIGIQDVVFVTRCDQVEIEHLLAECWRNGLRFIEWNYFVESTFRKLNVYDEHLDWLMHFGQQYAHPAYSRVKRALDIVIGFFGGVFLLPLLLVGCLLVLVFSGRPVFFTQPRVGARGQIFTVWKLRTMDVEQGREPSMWSSKGDDRITKIGRILRISRLDEIPQLIHVFSGEMSLVGPRPEWTEVAEKWENEIPFYSYRTMVKPGLTGWAQINFSYAETRDEVLEKLSYDFFYIKHASIMMDVRIILRTVSAMFEGGR